MMAADFAKRRQLIEHLAGILGEGQLEPDVQRRALDVFEAILRTPAAIAAPVAAMTAAASAIAPATGSRRLVYVHGICAHPAGYSNPWWVALQPFVAPARLETARLARLGSKSYGAMSSVQRCYWAPPQRHPRPQVNRHRRRPKSARQCGTVSTVTP